MDLLALQNRVRAIEQSLDVTAANTATLDSTPSGMLSELDELKRDAQRVFERATREANNRDAILAIAEQRRIIELMAKLRGEIKDQNVVVLLDPETAERIAEIYCARRLSAQAEDEQQSS